MRKLLMLLVFAGCITQGGTVGHPCNPNLSCEKGAMCAYNNQTDVWECVEKTKLFMPEEK